MDDRQNSYFNMFLSVQSACDNNEAAWSGFAPFAAAYVVFKAKIPLLYEAHKDQLSYDAGDTHVKATLRAAVVEKGAALSAALMAYATATTNAELALEAKTTTRLWRMPVPMRW